MPPFTLTRKAMADLITIGGYTQKRWGTEQRNTYLAMLDRCFQQLAADPLTGSDCSYIRSGYRKMNAGSHVIYYRLKQTDEVEIVRVLHQRMDLETRLFS
jgi:toxin ParE1/3/4